MDHPGHADEGEGEHRIPRCRPAFGCAFGTGRPEETNHPREVVEAELAHVSTNAMR